MPETNLITELPTETSRPREPISPELALVDPEFAAVARAELPAEP